MKYKIFTDEDFKNKRKEDIETVKTNTYKRPEFNIDELSIEKSDVLLIGTSLKR